MMRVEDAIRHLSRTAEFKQVIRNIYADDDVLVAALRFARSEEFQAAASLVAVMSVQPPAHVLDLGAGRGIASLAWAIRGYQVTAIEPDPSTLIGSGAIKHLINQTKVPITVIEAFGEHLPCNSSTFDLVYVRQTLHHAADLDKLCAEAARVLKPRGVLLATREHVVSNAQQLAAFLQNHPVHQLAGGEMAYPVARYKQALAKAGFKRIHVLNPFQSPINLYPETDASTRLMAQSTAQRVLGKRVGMLVSHLPLYYWAWTGFAAGRFGAPGRLYSFVAQK
jgi:ubiquinone/menaquinone biosynthesis C-methylase UbiE